MAARREDVDLHLVLRDPKCARKWIADYDWGPISAPEYVVFGIDDHIRLDSMNDEQAVLAAQIILTDVEIPSAFRVKQMLDEIEVH